MNWIGWDKLLPVRFHFRLRAMEGILQHRTTVSLRGGLSLAKETKRQHNKIWVCITRVKVRLQLANLHVDRRSLKLKNFHNSRMNT